MPTIIEFQGKRPTISASAFIAPNAVIIGDVTVGDNASIWYGAVIRGDFGHIEIGPGSNIQDNAVIHVNSNHDTILAAKVTVGHGAVLEGCDIGEGALIGMNATVLSGSNVGAGSLIAAGALVRERMLIPPGMLAAGLPAQVKGSLSDEQRRQLSHAAQHYLHAAESHRRNAILEPEAETPQ